MLRITTQTADGELVLRLEGCLAGPWVHELDTCWRGAVETLDGRLMRVDLTAVCHVDATGRELLAAMHRAGAHFVTKGCVMPEVVREISESADAGLPAEARSAKAG
jgi:ABC-type transporter Mla MlaB component